MTGLLSLLERKNLCFRSFNKLCFDFLGEIGRGETSGLEEFQRKRESLIGVLEQLEAEVSKELAGLGPTFMPTGDEKEEIAQLLREKDATVRSILDLDLQILGHIDRIRNDTIQKLQSVHAGKVITGAYRSPIAAIEAATGAKIVDKEA